MNLGNLSALFGSSTWEATLTPTKHPEAGSGYYEAVRDGELWPIRKPIPGFRVEPLNADGSIRGYGEDGLRPQAVHYRNSGSRFLRSSNPPAPAHDPECTACGYHLCADLDTLARYMHFCASILTLEDAHAPDAPAAWCVVEVTAEPNDPNRDQAEWNVAASIPRSHYSWWWNNLQATRHDRPKDKAGRPVSIDPPNTLRVTQIRLGPRVWVPDCWIDKPTPPGLAERVAAQYGVDVVKVPTVYEVPGMPNIGLPEPSGETWHPSGKFGRYGGAGALVRHNGRYLLIRRGSNGDRKGTWAPPGGALPKQDSSPWPHAQREVTEETEQQFTFSAPHGHVIFKGENGWSFTTFATDVGAPGQLRISKDNPEVSEARWVTAVEMQGMNLMPEFAAALPELLDLFPEDE